MIIAIDPGLSGGIAWQDAEIHSVAMPTTLKDIYDLLDGINISYRTPEAPGEVIVYIEQVGCYMPGNSGPAAARFAEHVGALKMALIALGLRHNFIIPAKWMHAYIGKPDYPEKKADYTPKAWKAILAKRKQERKTKIKEKSQQQFPDQKVTLKTADALGILWYAMREERGQLI